MDFVRELRPHQCTFVPDSDGQFTSDHGWDLPADARAAAAADRRGARARRARQPVHGPAARRRWPRARGVGADRVELYTETYARGARHAAAGATRCARFAAAARAAQAAGLGVNAGHDLNRDNLADFLRAVPGVLRGVDRPRLIADALELGYAETVRAYLRCHRRRPQPAPTR